MSLRARIAILVAVLAVLAAAFLGLGDSGAVDTLLSYTAVGIGTDAALLLLGRYAEEPAVAVPAAIFGHFCKFLVKWGLSVAIGARRGSWRWGWHDR